MLKRLRLKNWRSLRDVTIEDLTPITVFIGANSSGKTNILDALRFLQYSNSVDVLSAVRYKWGGREKIQTIGTNRDDKVEIGFDFYPNAQINQLLKYNFVMRFFDKLTPYIEYYQQLSLEGSYVQNDKDHPYTLPDTSQFGRATIVIAGDQNDKKLAISNYTSIYIKRRWQFFKELFTPQLTVALETDPGDLYVVEENGRNVAYMLDFMRDQRPDLYRQLIEDLSLLMRHVQNVDVKQIRQELNVVVREQTYPDLEAPGVSAGTARLIAMLTAYYALDMEATSVRSASGTSFEGWTIPYSQMPGLVMIEEPDTALNPGMLAKFVAQLRTYSERDESRQFILTTHNPAFLDFFQPEEVRVVSRDEHGDTHVERVPERIRENWLGEFGLGEVWSTNAFGGLP